MKILILGADGYLGWPTSMYFAAGGHDVMCVDNYTRRRIVLETDSKPLFPNPDLTERAALLLKISGNRLDVRIGDCRDFAFVSSLVQEFSPDAVIHYAEQPSAPYSMIDYKSAQFTLMNNLETTFNIIWALKTFAPDTHLIKLGTMGEYGTPNIDIEEGWIDIAHNGRKDRFLFPRQASSLYHTTKVLDTDLLWFYVRTYGLKVTDLMQGPVYGLMTKENANEERLYPNFHYDDIFGTVINRFAVQAACGEPLTVYGKGGQVRGYLNLMDTLACVGLAVENPPSSGELRIFNQFTETFTVLELAERFAAVGNQLNLRSTIAQIQNPRKELENHYYNPKHVGLSELGLKAHHLTDDVIAHLIESCARYKMNIERDKIRPRVRWTT